MPKFIIERDIPGAGSLSLSDLQAISEQSCGVLRSLGPQIQWVESYVTDDKVFCVYLSDTAELIRAHALRSGFAADRITRVRAIFDPTFCEVGLRATSPVHLPPTTPAAATSTPRRPRRTTRAPRKTTRSKRRAR
jgi:hypothetical protein